MNDNWVWSAVDRAAFDVGDFEPVDAIRPPDGGAEWPCPERSSGQETWAIVDLCFGERGRQAESGGVGPRPESVLDGWVWRNTMGGPATGNPASLDAKPEARRAGVVAPDPARSGWLVDALAQRGISRRQFLGFCASMTALLALPDYLTPEIVRALETKARPVLIWREFQDCAGNTESMLRSSHPDIAEIVLDLLSLEYHETIMAGSGKAAEAVIDRVRREKKGQYIAIVEGAIPTGSNAAYCTIGGKTAEQLVTELARDAALTIAVGACAWDGGFVALGPTGGKGLSAVVPGVPVINLGGCPHNPANTAAVIVHYLTFGEAPALDQYGRPLFAYGHIIHDQCERRAHFDAGRFVERWGDEGHRNGWCLYKMGCKGPAATFNCPIVRWNDATNWPIGAGHGCIACASPTFWSTMSPFYERLPNIQLFGVDASAQTIGLTAVAGVAVATAVHGAIVVGRRVREGRRATIGPGGQVLPEAEVPDPAAGAPVRLDGDGDERGGSA